MNNNRALEHNEDRFSQMTIEFLHTCDAVLALIREDIHTQVLYQQSRQPIPGAYFPYGRTSINDKIWPLLGEMGRLMKDNLYQEDAQEAALCTAIREAVKYFVYRLSYTPASDKLLPGTQDETKRMNATFTELPVFEELLRQYTTVTQEPTPSPTPPTVTLFPEMGMRMEEEGNSYHGATDALQRIAAGNTQTPEKGEPV